MPSHTRGKSRGSLSMLSFDGIRSFSRAGSRQARAPPTDDSGRSPSSLSHCDPYTQPPPMPELPNDRTERGREPSDPYHKENETPEQPSRKRRPLSWLSFSKTASSTPTGLPQRLRMMKDSSSTSLAKSTISAPVLTSTTNIKIAESRGVHCGETTPEMFDKSTWDGKIGWIPQDSATTARKIAHDMSLEFDTPKSAEGRPFRLIQAFKDRLRASRARHSFSLLHEDSLEDCRRRVGKDSLELRRIETMNYCREKLHRKKAWDFTSSHIAATTTSGDESAFSTEKRGDNSELPLLQDDISTASPQLPPKHDNSSQFDSLTRSLNSILDRGLESETTTMEFLKKKASKYRLRNETPTPSSDDAMPQPPLPSQFAQSSPEVSAKPQLAAEIPAQDSSKTPASTVKKPTSTEDQDSSATNNLNQIRRKPVGSSHDDIAKKQNEVNAAGPVVDASKQEENNSPAKQEDVRGLTRHMNGLAMHSNVMEFAEPPPGLKLPKPGLPYPEQLEQSGEYPTQPKVTQKLDLGTVLSTAQHEVLPETITEDERDVTFAQDVRCVRYATPTNDEKDETPTKPTGGMKKSLSRLLISKKNKEKCNREASVSENVTTFVEENQVLHKPRYRPNPIDPRKRRGVVGLPRF